MLKGCERKTLTHRQVLRVQRRDLAKRASADRLRPLCLLKPRSWFSPKYTPCRERFRTPLPPGQIPRVCTYTVDTLTGRVADSAVSPPKVTQHRTLRLPSLSGASAAVYPVFIMCVSYRGLSVYMYYMYIYIVVICRVVVRRGLPVFGSGKAARHALTCLPGALQLAGLCGMAGQTTRR